MAAKIDTGARTSALHVERVKELPAGRVRFDVCLEADAPEKRVRVEAAVERRGRVRASNGGVEIRVFVGARIALGGVERRIEIGLVDRSEMLYRMLLGRSALAGSFLIDPGRRYVCGR